MSEFDRGNDLRIPPHGTNNPRDVFGPNGWETLPVYGPTINKQLSAEEVVKIFKDAKKTMNTQPPLFPEVELPLKADPQTYKVRQVFSDNLRLFDKKQKAYGRGNIDAFGELGVLVRLFDKLSRLKNLLHDGGENSPELKESIADTWKDIINYGAIGYLCHKGEW